MPLIALREKIEQDLEGLENPGAIEPVQYSKWAKPIAPVTKSDQTARLCRDYKLATNGHNQFAWHPSRENQRMPRKSLCASGLSGYVTRPISLEMFFYFVCN